MGCGGSKESRKPDSVSDPLPRESEPSGSLSENEEVVDEVAKQHSSMVEWAKASGFRIEHPVAVFPSLSGVQLEVVESSLKPSWEGQPLWLNMAELTTTTMLNTVDVGKKARKSNEWRSRLLQALDRDGDGDIEAEDITEFITTEESLKEDGIVKAVLRKAESIEMSAKELMDELKLVHDKIAVALLKKRNHHPVAGVSAEQKVARASWARHMQLHDGWKDPQEGEIKVRPKAGLVAMEYLYGGDGTSTIANALGLGLMIGVTKKLRGMGYEEGKNIRGYGYDWRAPCTRLEERDGHYSKIMKDMEDLVATNGGKKIVVITHSLGGVCAHYFFHWVAKSPQGQARGGVEWLSRHIHSFIPIAAPTLGAPDGSHSFLSGDEGQGLAPMVMSFADRHIVIRSWLMFGMIFPAGCGLMLQPARSPHWIRRESILRVHVLTVSKTLADDETEEINSGFTGRVQLKFITPKGCKTRSHTLKTSRQYLRTHAAFDDWFQFAWNSDQISGAKLEIKLIRSFGLTTVTEKSITREIFPLNSLDDGDASPTEMLISGKNQQLNLDIGKGFTVDLTARFVSPGGHFGSELDFRNDDPGAQQCGGPTDVFTTKEKQKRLVEQLGEIEGSEWEPFENKVKKGETRDAPPYTPINIDEFMVIDGMKHGYKNWKESYAEDAIWRECATIAPPIRRVKLVYGINVTTRVGSVFRHVTKRYERDEPTTGLKPDKHCKVVHPGYSIDDGIVHEVPGKTPQADDASVDVSKMTFGVRASGDGTVPYWSLRWPVTWRNSGVEVDDPVEVEGVNHRDILKTRECHEVVFGECLSCPTHYIECWLENFELVGEDVTGYAKVTFTWHGITYGSEKVSINPKSSKKMAFKRRRFVFGVTNDDVQTNNAIEMKIYGPASGKSKDEPPFKLKVRRMLADSEKLSSTVKVGDINLKWYRFSYAANSQGMPRKDATQN